MNRHAGAFTRRIQTGKDRAIIVHNHFAVFVGGDTAHGVMCRRLDGHHLRDGVHAEIHTAEVNDIGQFRQHLFTSDFVR